MTLSWGGQCHQMTQGGGRGLAKVSRKILKNFEPYFCILSYFFEGKRLVFWKIKMSHEGGGSKIDQNSVTYYLNDP